MGWGVSNSRHPSPLSQDSGKCCSPQLPVFWWAPKGKCLLRSHNVLVIRVPSPNSQAPHYPALHPKATPDSTQQLLVKGNFCNMNPLFPVGCLVFHEMSFRVNFGVHTGEQGTSLSWHSSVWRPGLTLLCPHPILSVPFLHSLWPPSPAMEVRGE